MELEAALDRIRAAGGRVTAARVAILEVLLNGPHHATADEIEQRVPDVHQATFYRTLAALEELGVVYHLHVDHGPSIWHVATDVHEHLVCRQCGRVVEIDGSVLAPLRTAIASATGFMLDTRHFVQQGLCRDCQPPDPGEVAERVQRGVQR